MPVTGLNAMYARHYMLVRTDGGLNWDDMGPSIDFDMEWIPVDTMGTKVYSTLRLYDSATLRLYYTISLY